MHNERNKKHDSAEIMVWAKGYRITKDSEEFQLCVPRKPTTELSLSSMLSVAEWQSLLEPLYGISQQDSIDQRCALFEPDSVAVVCFAPTRDRHRRPSLLFTAAVIEIDWSSAQVWDNVSRASSLAARLAQTYAKSFDGNPEAVGDQLQTGTFLSETSFNLSDESFDESIDWKSVISAVMNWQGVRGIASSKMHSFGANVVLGNMKQAGSVTPPDNLDGYFDPSIADIVPLTSRLTRWHRAEEKKQKNQTGPARDYRTQDYYDPIYPLVESIRWMERTVDRMADALFALVDELSKHGKKK